MRVRFLGKEFVFILVLAVFALSLLPLNQVQAEEEAVKITRGEFIEALVIFLGLEVPEQATETPFTYLPAYYGRYYQAAAEAELIDPNPARLNPDVYIPREEAVVMIWRTMAEEEVDEAVLARYIDGAEVSPEYKPIMAHAVWVGFVAGYPDKTLRLQAALTLQEMFYLLDRCYYIHRAAPYIEDLEVRVPRRR